jgi:hypothetical protein
MRTCRLVGLRSSWLLLCLLVCLHLSRCDFGAHPYEDGRDYGGMLLPPEHRHLLRSSIFDCLSIHRHHRLSTNDAVVVFSEDQLREHGVLRGPEIYLFSSHIGG